MKTHRYISARFISCCSIQFAGVQSNDPPSSKPGGQYTFKCRGIKDLCRMALRLQYRSRLEAMDAQHSKQVRWHVLPYITSKCRGTLRSSTEVKKEMLLFPFGLFRVPENDSQQNEGYKHSYAPIGWRWVARRSLPTLGGLPLVV